MLYYLTYAEVTKCKLLEQICNWMHIGSVAACIVSHSKAVNSPNTSLNEQLYSLQVVKKHYNIIQYITECEWQMSELLR